MRSVIICLISALTALAAIADDGKKTDGFYIMGYEANDLVTAHGQDPRQNDIVEMTFPNSSFDAIQAKEKKASARAASSQKSRRVNFEENSKSLHETLASFQTAISGLCIAQLELNLAFNISAKAWMVVDAGAEATVKVLLKNPDQKCPSGT